MDDTYIDYIEFQLQREYFSSRSSCYRSLIYHISSVEKYKGTIERKCFIMHCKLGGDDLFTIVYDNKRLTICKQEITSGSFLFLDEILLKPSILEYLGLVPDNKSSLYNIIEYSLLSWVCALDIIDTKNIRAYGISDNKTTTIIYTGNKMIKALSPLKIGSILYMFFNDPKLKKKSKHINYVKIGEYYIFDKDIIYQYNKIIRTTDRIKVKENKVKSKEKENIKLKDNKVIYKYAGLSLIISCVTQEETKTYI